LLYKKIVSEENRLGRRGGFLVCPACLLPDFINIVLSNCINYKRFFEKKKWRGPI